MKTIKKKTISEVTERRSSETHGFARMPKIQYQPETALTFDAISPIIARISSNNLLVNVMFQWSH